MKDTFMNSMLAGGVKFLFDRITYTIGHLILFLATFTACDKGRCLAIIQSTKKPGIIKAIAKAKGMNNQVVFINAH